MVDRGSLKALVRRLVLATSFPPFLQLYRLLYGIVLCIVVRRLRKQPGVRAVYLRRGFAKGEWVPGVSDLDFQVIVDRVDRDQGERLRRAYGRLCRTMKLPDPDLGIADEGMLRAMADTPWTQYRLMAGKATWKLLYGKDCLADIPDLSIPEMYGGLLHEIGIWWTLIALKLLKPEAKDIVLRNSLCYKAVAETLKVPLAWNHGVLVFLRDQALENAEPHLDGEGRRVIEKLKAVRRGRFLSRDAYLLDETLHFFLRYVDGFYRSLSSHPFASPIAGVTARTDCAHGERLSVEEQHAHASALAAHAREHWGGSYRGAHLVSSLHCDMDELQLMVEVDSQRLPRARDLAGLLAAHERAPLPLRSRLHVYLLLEHCAFRLDADYHKGWLSILSRAGSSDLFALLSRPEFTIDGRPRPEVESAWTPMVSEFCEDRIRTLRRRLRDAAASAAPDLALLRLLWKITQLHVIRRSASRRRAVFPLTLAAVERALIEERTPLPPRLEGLAVAYRDALEGRRTGTALASEALSFVEALKAERP